MQPKDTSKNWFMQIGSEDIALLVTHRSFDLKSCFKKTLVSTKVPFRMELIFLLPLREDELCCIFQKSGKTLNVIFSLWIPFFFFFKTSGEIQQEIKTCYLLYLA